MALAESQDLLEHFRLNAVVKDQYTTHAKPQICRSQGRRKTTVKKRWTRKQILGTGGFGEVWLETSIEGDQVDTRAVKVISKDGMKSYGIDYKKELLALAKFTKPEYQEEEVFVRFFGWYQNEINLYISMEYFPLGDLSLHLNDAISEVDIKHITSDLLRGLQIIHQENFAHRDLKPKNIFVVQKPPHSAWWVKIGDFGISKRAVADTALHTQIGTASYTAPEILGYFDSTTLHAGYDNAVDMWSLGCVIYELVTKSKLYPTAWAVMGYCEGKLPFPKQNLLRLMSPDGINFLRSLVVPNPRHRLTAEDALGDNWVAQVIEYQERRSSRPDCLDIQGFNSHATLQHHTANVSPVNAQLPPHRAEVTVANNSGWTALHTASSHGHVEIVRPLLEDGADTKIASNDGMTPVNSACDKGHIEVVKLLLEHRADITIPNNSGMTPVYFASLNGHYDIVKLLVKNGADITVAENSGWTPINAASSNGHVDVVQLLLAHGADISVSNKEGMTPVYSASLKGHHDLVKLLIENGADITVMHKNGWTPVNTACKEGHLEVVKLLLRYGADITVAENSGWTPINAASSNGHVDVVQLLLAHGADISISNKEGMTPVYSASLKGHHDLVKLLIENGADITVMHKNGWTPVNTACKEGHLEVVQLLLENGADITIANNDGATPIDTASKEGHVDVVKLLLENGIGRVAQPQKDRVPSR